MPISTQYATLLTDCALISHLTCVMRVPGYRHRVCFVTVVRR
jgi:hypothetical protein